MQPRKKLLCRVGPRRSAMADLSALIFPTSEAGHWLRREHIDLLLRISLAFAVAAALRNVMPALQIPRCGGGGFLTALDLSAKDVSAKDSSIADLSTKGLARGNAQEDAAS